MSHAELRKESSRLLANACPIVNHSASVKGVSGLSELSGDRNCTLHPLAISEFVIYLFMNSFTDFKYGLFHAFISNFPSNSVPVLRVSA